MKAARVYEPGKIVIEDIPLPQLGGKDVLIKVHRVGICGTLCTCHISRNSRP
jgi:L-iditol 2-dehydrogenase